MELTLPPITLRPYQARAITWLSTRKRGIVCAPAGSGKTLMAAGALEKVVLSVPRAQKVRVGWIAHTIEQKEQALTALEQFPALNETCDIVVACAASEVDWSDRDVLIVDECHWAGCDQWSKQVLACPGARWGFTATPWGEDVDRNSLLSAMFGDQCLTITRDEVAGNIVPAKVIMLDATDQGIGMLIDVEIERLMTRRAYWWKGEDWELRAICTWQACIKLGIVNNRSRNEAAIKTALQHTDDSVLILVNEIEHGQSLSERIPGSKLCYSKMGRKERRCVLADFKAGEIKCIVATSLLDEGADLPIARVLIMVSGGRSNAKTEQRTGRVLRLYQGKDHGIIYDFHDRQHSTMRNHSLKRMATYRRLGYEIGEG